MSETFGQKEYEQAIPTADKFLKLQELLMV